MINPCDFRSPNRNTKPSNNVVFDPVMQTQTPESGSQSLNANHDGLSETIGQPTMIFRIPSPASTNPEGIILANLNAMWEDPWLMMILSVALMRE